jgi:hypothetical protein
LVQAAEPAAGYGGGAGDAIQFDPLAGAIYTRTMQRFVGMAFPIWFALTFGLLYVGFRIGYVHLAMAA